MTKHINKMHNSMIISIDSEKAFDKVQYNFMIKKPKNKFPQPNRGHCENPQLLWESMGKNYNLFLWWYKATMPLSPLLFTQVLEMWERKRSDKKKKYKEFRLERSKIILVSRWHDSVCISLRYAKKITMRSCKWTQ
jgi:hypothetical protein